MPERVDRVKNSRGRERKEKRVFRLFVRSSLVKSMAFVEYVGTYLRLRERSGREGVRLYVHEKYHFSGRDS